MDINKRCIEITLKIFSAIAKIFVYSTIPFTLTLLSAFYIRYVPTVVGKGTSQPAPVTPFVDEITVSMEKDFRDVPLSEKKTLIEEYNQILLGYHEKIQTSVARYADTFETVWFANSEGTYIKDVMLAGNAYTALKEIIPISKEREWVSGPVSFFVGLFPYVQVGELNVTVK